MGTLWCSRQEREEGTYLNTRMSLCGLILVFEMRGRGESGGKGGRRWCEGPSYHPDMKNATL